MYAAPNNVIHTKPARIEMRMASIVPSVHPSIVTTLSSNTHEDKIEGYRVWRKRKDATNFFTIKACKTST